MTAGKENRRGHDFRFVPTRSNGAPIARQNREMLRNEETRNVTQFGAAIRLLCSSISILFREVVNLTLDPLKHKTRHNLFEGTKPNTNEIYGSLLESCLSYEVCNAQLTL
ncbi:hypothetical protein OUZ56_004531 [Daphnia magna]|uniref:Uncharacterized protein n=1 Tax=Daphnia magna TaxID=35525 RepID=A0ABQ9YQB8_9CRUS|nr:hypothetical protein OUZ56_004531 [Daphnia magna]